MQEDSVNPRFFPAHHLRSQFKQVHADRKRARAIACGSVARGWKARAFAQLRAVHLARVPFQH